MRKQGQRGVTVQSYEEKLKLARKVAELFMLYQGLTK